MRYGIFSDVHSNLEALDAVLHSIAQEGVDQLLCAGDLVGYGADPGPCLARLREKVTHIVCGNHDRAAIGRMDLDWFNPRARAAAEWTAKHLSQTDREYLATLPLVWQGADATLVHGSLHEPDQFHYIFDCADAQLSFPLQETPVAFIGHTHVPVIFVEEGSAVRAVNADQITVASGQKVLVNVGSVGQPRDRDPRAAYCLYDTVTRLLRIRRVPYSIAQAQEKIRAAGLPEFFAERLSAGV